MDVCFDQSVGQWSGKGLKLSILHDALANEKEISKSISITKENKQGKIKNNNVGKPVQNP